MDCKIKCNNNKNDVEFILYIITIKYGGDVDMEPQGCYEYKKCEKRRNCLCIIAVILSILFSFVIGLLVGAIFGLLILVALPAVIVLAIVLGLLLLLTIILMICKREKCC